MSSQGSRGLSPSNPITVGVGLGDDGEARDAVRKAIGAAVAELPEDPALVVLSCRSGYDLSELLASARAFAGPVPLVGGTSAPGLTTRAGVVQGGRRGRGVTAMALAGADVTAGVGQAEIGSHPRRAGEEAARAALASVTPAAGSPSFALLFSSPGNEESVLAGVVATLGRGVPLLGFTVADEKVAGEWAVFSRSEAMANGVVVAVAYGPFLAGAAFGTGYWPAAEVATAGGVDGRMVSKLGGRPAAEVYAEWLGVGVSELMGIGVRRYAAMQPLAVEDPRTRVLQIKEPGTVAPDGSMGLFADVREGDAIRLASCTEESLISAAGSAASEAMMRASLRPELVRGVLLSQGAGRAALLEEQAGEVPSQLRRAVGDAPLLGMAGYGEQCVLPDGRPVHLNLTAAVLVLGG